MVTRRFSFGYAGETFVSSTVLLGVRQQPVAPDAIEIKVHTDLAARVAGVPQDIGRHEGALVGRSEGEATFCFDRASRVLEIEYCQHVTEARRTQVLLDWVVPYVLTELENLVLHATAVCLDGVAWAFSGMSGRGKSTLAVSLAQAGYPLVADDTFVIAADRATVLPSHPSARLKNDSMRAVVDEGAVEANEKTVLGDLQLSFHEAPLPIGGVFLLEPEGPLGISTATAADVPTLLEQTYVLPGAGIARGLDEVAALIERNQLFTLTYPRDYGALPSVVQAVRTFTHGMSEGSS